MDAERPPPLGDVDQAAHEVRQLAGQRGELVDHDRQPRNRRERRLPCAQVEVVGQILRACRRQQVFAPPQLGPERLERAFDQMRVEVGHHADGVRQVDAVLERGAALVVDEHEVHLVGPIGHREGGHEGLQQFALARAGRAGDQRVRPVDAEVDREGAVEGFADHGHRAARRQQPAGLDRVGRRRIQAQHVEQTARVRDRTVIEFGAGIPDGRDAPRHPVEPVVVDEVGTDAAQHVDALLADGQPVRLGDDHRRALLGQQPFVGVDADAVDPDRRPLLQQAHQARHAAQAARAVDHDDDLGAGPEGSGRPSRGAVRVAPRVELRDQFGDPTGGARRRHAERRQGVLPGGGAHVGEPRHPAPGVLTCRVAQQIQLHVARALQHRDLRGSPLREATGSIAEARDPDDAAFAELESRGHVAGIPGDRALVLQLLGVVEGDTGRLGGGADAQPEVVGVVLTSLPQPRERAGRDLAQLGRIGGGVQQPGAFGDERLLRLGLDDGLVIPVLGELLAVRFLAATLVEEIVRHEHDR